MIAVRKTIGRVLDRQGPQLAAESMECLLAASRRNRQRRSVQRAGQPLNQFKLLNRREVLQDRFQRIPLGGAHILSSFLEHVFDRQSEAGDDVLNCKDVVLPADLRLGVPPIGGNGPGRGIGDPDDLNPGLNVIGDLLPDFARPIIPLRRFLVRGLTPPARRRLRLLLGFLEELVIQLVHEFHRNLRFRGNLAISLRDHFPSNRDSIDLLVVTKDQLDENGVAVSLLVQVFLFEE
jgi:hypothetical protein